MQEQIPDFPPMQRVPAIDIGEHILLRTYSGDAGQLQRSMGELILLQDYLRMKEVELFTDRLVEAAGNIGFLSIGDILIQREEHLEDMCLGED